MLRHISEIVRFSAQALSLSWVPPNFAEEAGEYFENSATRKFLTARGITFPDEKHLVATFRGGRLMDISMKVIRDFQNVTWRKEDFTEELKNPEYRLHYDEMVSQLERSGHVTLPAPIILYIKKTGEYWGFSGNRRTNLALHHNIPLKAWVVTL